MTAFAQPINQTNIFMGHRWLESTNGHISIARDSNIRAVDMTMPIAVAIATAKTFDHAPPERAPISDAHGAAHGVSAMCQLCAQPVARYATIGIRRPNPACSLRKNQLGRACACEADIARARRDHRGALAACQNFGCVIARVRTHDDEYTLAIQRWIATRHIDGAQTFADERLFIVRGNDDADHVIASRRQRVST